ncbi:DUF3144 domain-containing protein [Simiduia agarivorans]|uniref:DUF3144 domain-containing protein n=1 Tax=Simiduia agarivorans (strain DSM 21679 / JCM 13881 / BCRC 17597 / SA1) TaxID=1117647 RepID=K4KIF0_SIMAS|nr:DUF3144 domain-containing protein [Simiduia agarivorans]AFU98929.1 hypothetical protein M5M_08700 [Simiduia agarivorans SA1 = DSM 21679]
MAQTNDDAFWQLVEQFIERANDAPESLELTEVGGALMVAASRFNAYALAASSIDKASFKDDRDGLLKDYVNQFRSLLADDLEDYANHYKTLIGNTDEAGDA